ncbi:titin-like isoform X2 [Mercenaria mercenaria]|uniref:titin-like isoform X2 n=1 Tax=Mercenaria mercenaria TaxID=6596 RepID=UPI00234E65D6|nr:titin-like isoform X2 [Mercenaria mercenaria]
MADSGGITPPGTESHAGSGQDKTKAKATEGTSQTANLPPPDQTASGSSSAKNPPGQSRDGPSKLADSASGSVQKDPGKKKNKDREENRGLTEKKQGMFVIDKRQEYKPKYCSSEQKKTEHIKEKLLKVKSTQTEIKKDDSEAETIADKPDNKTEKLEVVTDGKQNLDEEHRSDEQVAKQNKDQHFSGTDGQQAQTSHTDTYRKTKEESEGLEILDLGSSFVLVSHNQSAEIPINVKTLTGKVIRINAKLTDTIGKVMEKIKDKEGIAADVQRLIFDGKQLEENHTLLEYSIGKGSTIHLVVSRKTGMQIYVTKPNKEKILLDVQRNYSVAKIKAMIKDESDIFAENWCLRFGKAKLEDENKTLADYSILHGSSLIVFLPRKTDKPSAPKDLTVCDITSGSCKPCWGKPENDGGSSIIEYIVQWREANAEKWTESTCSATECMIKSLKESTQYIFRVAAKNIIGTGEFTAHIELETKWSYKCNGSMNIKSGKPMFLEMKFKGQKPHESYIHCLFNGSEHPNKNRTNIEITDSKIIFKLENVVLSDKGEYILTAENKTGSGAVSAILYVIGEFTDIFCFYKGK